MVLLGMDDLGQRIEPLVRSSPRRLSGAPVFNGTRVPVETMCHYLEAGDPLATFLDDFPSVTREQAVAVLRAIRDQGLPRITVESGDAHSA
jgi:uncharacterized protein (DUF433 family)